MALYLRRQEPTYCWGIWKMDETYDELCALLPPAVVVEAEERFSASHRRQEWLSVRALLARLIGNNQTICYYPSGKPYLSDSSSFISISHTRHYVAVIIGTQPVGIDIEQYGQRVHKVISKFVREDETVNSWKGDDTWSLLLHWSAKEVMFKCLDTDAVDFQAHLRIFPFVLQLEGFFLAREYKTEQQRLFLIHYLLHPDFVLTWEVG